MSTESLSIRRLPLRLTPDSRRTITRFFWPGKERAIRIIERVKTLADNEIANSLEKIIKQFSDVNPGLEEILLEHYEKVVHQSGLGFDQDLEIRMLIGAYFSMEYAFESAALFNPSMIPSYDQEGVPEGSLRFTMSLRTVGEGHISSIAFRRGIVDGEGNITINPSSLFVRRLRRKENRLFQKEPFEQKIHQLNCNSSIIDTLLDALPDPFTHLQLQQKVEFLEHKELSKTARENLEMILWLARADYRIGLDEDIKVEDMVLFPISETESQGMEDMRLVHFIDDDGTFAYYGTYTAFNGRQILPQIMEIKNRSYADILTLHGQYAQNKGLALFPKRIEGKYAAIGRVDGENLFLLKTDRVDFWNQAEMILQPKYKWEYIQIGNCSSPIETDAGWLLLTHGVGPMRQYCMGAVLLDKDEPSKVIGELDEPLLSPTDEERSGYVPNVVYSCGGLIHNNNLIIPYGISDAATGFAVVELGQLLGKLSR
ncbi:MAG: glycoside hydrolase family 130 protein [Planctomycetota bacterium]|jgi:predicted GH43/DUF377 family glycosyl hydrolase